MGHVVDFRILFDNLLQHNEIFLKVGRDDVVLLLLNCREVMADFIQFLLSIHTMYAGMEVFTTPLVYDNNSRDMLVVNLSLFADYPQLCFRCEN